MHINDLIEPGYYIEEENNNDRTFIYAGETIPYMNGIIVVERQSNRIIQHVYATEEVTVNNTRTWKLNGTEYRRWGIYENNSTRWQKWHLTHKPYTRISRISGLGPGVNNGSVEIYENTAGYIIKWNQNNSNQDEYPISAQVYQYADVCTFYPHLPIQEPYVFGNLIGRFDIKITKDKMQIRSNVPQGGRIIEMHETYFIPRNE